MTELAAHHEKRRPSIAWQVAPFLAMIAAFFLWMFGNDPHHVSRALGALEYGSMTLLLAGVVGFCFLPARVIRWTFPLVLPFLAISIGAAIDDESQAWIYIGILMLCIGLASLFLLPVRPLHRLGLAMLYGLVVAPTMAYFALVAICAFQDRCL